MLSPLLKELNNGIYVKYGNNISLFVHSRVGTTIKSMSEAAPLSGVRIMMEWKGFWRGFTLSLTVLILGAFCDQVSRGMIEN